MLNMNTQTQYLVNRYKTKKNCVHLNSCHTKMKNISSTQMSYPVCDEV